MQNALEAPVGWHYLLLRELTDGVPLNELYSLGFLVRDCEPHCRDCSLEHKLIEISLPQVLVFHWSQRITVWPRSSA